MNRYVVWFSCGAASAIAAKLTLEKYGNDSRVVYCDTLESEHPDNERFFLDVEKWLGVRIEIVRSATYRNIDDVFEMTRYMAGIAGARCTTEMKKLPRLAYQQETDTHVFGFTSDEAKRATECLARLAAVGIALPAMYALGFDHNNCIGCVKATSPGYWNRTRRLFPETFARRADQSRRLGARLVRVEGKRVFLDELPPEADAADDDIECGPACQMPDRSWEQLPLPTEAA